MTLRLIRAIAILFVLFALVSAVAQQTTTNPLAPPPASPANQAPPPKPPDMVCWGSGPNWSIQFVSWGARYLGINQPDQDFLGGFFWVPDQKVWVWQRKNNLAPVSGYALSATITKASCTDPVRKETFPCSAQVNLPAGRHGQRLLPQVEARRSPRRAARLAAKSVATAAPIEKTRGALRQRVLPVSCWDWPEAVHSRWPQRSKVPSLLNLRWAFPTRQLSSRARF